MAFKTYYSYTKHYWRKNQPNPLPWQASIDGISGRRAPTRAGARRALFNKLRWEHAKKTREHRKLVQELASSKRYLRMLQRSVK